jgi:hypothetical protein
MSTMVVEIYDALRSIGVAEDKAAKAAEAMATLEPQFAAMRSEMQAMDSRMQAQFATVRPDMQAQFAAVRSDMQAQFAAVRSEMRMLKWQVGLLYAITGPTLLLLLRVAAKVGAFG